LLGQVFITMITTTNLDLKKIIIIIIIIKKQMKG
jgi:hypothetical protein